MKKSIRVLVVDDDPLVQSSCERILALEYDLIITDTGEKGLELLTHEPFDLALVDLKLPGVSGMEILRHAPDRFPDVPIIIITGYSTVKSAVDAIKMGAFDYVAKPFSPDELEAAITKALRRRKLIENYRGLQATLSDRYHISRLIGKSDSMKRVIAAIEQVAATDSTVLLTGESGTGKDLAARAIHFLGRRKDKRFIAVDCGAIAPHLITSELFGHARGSFTGAISDHAGLIRDSDHGTLFLDEINNLPMDLQATLLRVIETGEVRAVGASSATEVEVRYVAATNTDLQKLVKERKFREDLFYRLNVFPIHLPALREHKEDIPALALHFLTRFSTGMHKRVEDFTQQALDALVQYDWPGNVRELSNVIERLVILSSEGRIGHAHVQESLAVTHRSTALPRTIEELNAMRKELREHATDEIEKAFLLDALRRNDYNASQAAAETGMQRTNFQTLLKKHGLRIKDLILRHEKSKDG